MKRAAILIFLLLFAALPLRAEATLERLIDLLEIDAYNLIIREEGLADADSLSLDLLGRPADSALMTELDRIYDTDRMAAHVRDTLRREMTPLHLTRAAAYFSSDPSQHIISLEVAARRAMSSDELEEAATRGWIAAEEEHPWLVARVREMSDVNDLLERNVAGALNANLHFFRGLAQGDALQMSEAEILSQVWSQEDQIRGETDLWIGAYLTLAYKPLEEPVLTDYIAFWSTETGKALNRAIFSAFNDIYNEISFATGRILALSVETQEL